MKDFPCPACGEFEKVSFRKTPGLDTLPNLAWEWVETEGSFHCDACGNDFTARVRYHFPTGVVERVTKDTEW
jgi:predicted RNA-binding Zn-ribbon protein involved in translation (DUF1610 family)